MNVRAVLNQYGLRPSKGLGQNFLTNESVLWRIVEASEIGPLDTVIEIGPGLGQLTEELVQRARQVVAIELDHKMVAILDDRLGDCDHLTIIQGDILETALSDLVRQTGVETADGGTIRIVANLPYYIPSAAIRHVLESDLDLSLITLMVQHEVAQRIVAKPGKMSLLAVSVQVYGTPELVHRVPSGAFYPQPKVDSAVLTIRPHPQPLVDKMLLPTFFRAVQYGFQQKRKQIHNSLGHGLSLGREQTMALLLAAKIDPQRRPQTLTIPEWGRLAAIIDAGPSA